MADRELNKLCAKNPPLIHAEAQKVVSHTQRDQDEWILNTITIEGFDVPFKYKRTQKYKSLVGARVNLTYYPTVEKVAGLEFEVMTVVRLRRY